METKQPIDKLIDNVRKIFKKIDDTGEDFSCVLEYGDFTVEKTDSKTVIKGKNGEMSLGVEDNKIAGKFSNQGQEAKIENGVLVLNNNAKLEEDFRNFEESLRAANNLTHDINSIIGRDSFKKILGNSISELAFRSKVDGKLVKKPKKDEEVKVNVGKQSFNFVFCGTSGTGRTYAAQRLMTLFNQYGIVGKKKTDPKARIQVSELIMETLSCSSFSEGGLKVNDVFENVKKGSGVLVLEDLNSMIGKEDNVAAKKLLAELKKAMNVYRGDVVVIFRLNKAEMELLGKLNVEFKDIFSSVIEFREFTPKELLAILKEKFEDEKKGSNLVFTDEVEQQALKVFDDITRLPDSGGAHSVKLVYNEIITRQSIRTKGQFDVPTIIVSKGVDLSENILEKIAGKDAASSLKRIELDDIVGVKKFKEMLEDIKENRAMIKQLGLPPHPLSHYNLVLSGNPGTGKTTLAKIYTQVLNDIGILPLNKFIPTTAKDFEAGYVGQTSGKTANLVERAFNGSLFIDEFTGLDVKFEGDYKKDAQKGLLAPLEEANFQCTIADYKTKLDAFWRNSLNDDGLYSRFASGNALGGLNEIYISDYNAEELAEITTKKLKSLKNMELSLGAKDILIELMNKSIKSAGEKANGNGNGRYAAKVCESFFDAQLKYFRTKGIRPTPEKFGIIEADAVASFIEKGIDPVVIKDTDDYEVKGGGDDRREKFAVK